MAEPQMVRCVVPCWWAEKAIYFVPGDEAMIDPENPIAMYFDGFKPGTKVYHKTKGSTRKGATKEPKETFRVVPGKVEEEETEETGEEAETAKSIEEIEAEASAPKVRVACPWPECEKDYQDESRLKAHLTKVHGGERPEEE